MEGEMGDYYWQVKVQVGKKYDPRQPRWPKGTPQGGQWAPAAFARLFGQVTSKEATLAEGDDTELYRWSNLAEVVDATNPMGQRAASLDVTDQPWWYFAPPHINPKTGSGWASNVYGRVILDREKLREAGWVKDPHLTPEGAWRHMPARPGSAARTDREMQAAYLDAIRGFEVTTLPEGDRTVADVQAILNFRLDREVPVILTDVRHVTDPFRDQRTF
jgi:hypothetical protein